MASTPRAKHSRALALPVRLGARRASLCLVGKTLMHFRAGVHIRLQMPAHARRASAKKLRCPR